VSISCLLRVNTYTINIYIFRYCNLSISKIKSNGQLLLSYLFTCIIPLFFHFSHFVLVILYAYVYILYIYGVFSHTHSITT